MNTLLLRSAIFTSAAFLSVCIVQAEDLSSVSDYAAGVCDGSLKSETLVADAITRAKAADNLNIIVSLDADGAMAAAKNIDSAGADIRCKPLAGVPIVVKDNTHVAGIPSTAGTPALQNFIPTEDAPVVSKLRDAGAIVLAKTTLHELAFGISGHNPAVQTAAEPGVRNAYNSNHVAGGSSSGTGAAVGARVVAAGLGTDTGGSVRIPCAFNGCASLRPTIGRYPSAGIAPISHTRDTPGAMALTIADVELLDRVITDADPIEPATLTGVRLGTIAALQSNSDEDTAAVFASTIEKLKSAGVEIVDIDAPDLFALNGAVGFPLALYEAYDDMVTYLDQFDTGVTIDALAAAIVSPDVKGTYDGLVIPRKLPGPDNTLLDAKPAYDDAINNGLPALQDYYSKLFSENNIEAILFPTTPVVAMLAGPESSSLENFLLIIQNTDLAGNAGIPGLQIPAGIGAQSGLPVGVELDGPQGSDRRLLELGLAIESLLGRLPMPEQ